MYTALQYRYQLVLDDCIDLLCDVMAPPRGFAGDDRPRTPITSSASTPSLRSRTPVTVATPPPESMTPGGNVKVVVRVRDFLQRGGLRGSPKFNMLTDRQSETEAHNA
jgi:hypothetical protein